MSFNPGPSKQAQAVILNGKLEQTFHPLVSFLLKSFNLFPPESCRFMFKYVWPFFEYQALKYYLHRNISALHWKTFLLLLPSLDKINQTLGLLRKLQDVLFRTSLLALFKSFTRPHLDCGDIVYDIEYNSSFH